jgi:hypothetical protein
MNLTCANCAPSPPWPKPAASPPRRSSCTSRSRRSACWCANSNARWACSCSTGNTRSVQLSEAGREFLPSVHRLLGDLTSAVAGVTDLRDKKKGLLRLAAPQLMACTLMPRVIAVYREIVPRRRRAPGRHPARAPAGGRDGRRRRAGRGAGRGHRRRHRAPHAVPRPALADLPAGPCLCQAPQGALARAGALHLHRAHARLPPARAARAGRGRARVHAARRHPGGVVHDDRAGHGGLGARAHGVPDLFRAAGARPWPADGAARIARLPPRGVRLQRGAARAVAGGGELRGDPRGFAKAAEAPPTEHRGREGGPKSIRLRQEARRAAAGRNLQCRPTRLPPPPDP